MPGRECYHCKQWIDEGEAHDCWTTTEAALTADLTDDLLDAWERLRETLVELGPQRVYASGSCIMFSRDVCYVFVRPKRKALEVAVFLDRAVKAPQVKRVERKSKAKVAVILHLTHRDEVEAPLTDWFADAYALPERLAAEKARAATAPKTAKTAKTGKTTKTEKTANAAKTKTAKTTRKR